MLHRYMDLSPELLDYFSKRLVEEDAVVAEQMIPVAGRLDDFTVVGICKWYNQNTRKRSYSIINCSDEYFRRTHPCGYESLALSSVVMYQDGKKEIYINRRLRELYFDPLTYDIARGVIAHEIGHIVAGHFDIPLAEKNDSEVIPVMTVSSAELIVQRLFAGEHVEPLELEANLYAVAMVGIGPVVTMLYDLVDRVYGIAIAIQHSNTLHKLLSILHTDPDQIRSKQHWKLERFTLFSDQELIDNDMRVPTPR